MNLFHILLGVFIILCIIAVALICVRNIPKGKIVRMFKVDNKTLQNWMNTRMPKFAAEWKKRRKFSAYQLELMFQKLGNPFKSSTADMKGILYKLEKEEKEELPAAKYRLLHQLVPDIKRLFPGMSLFPPIVAERIYLIAKGDLNAKELAKI